MWRQAAGWQRSALGVWKRAKSRFDATHPGRTLVRYGAQNGNVLSGGIAYYSLASLAAGFVLAATLTSLLSRALPGGKDALFELLGQLIPGAVGEDGLVSADARIVVPVAGVVGLAALLALLNTATRVLGGLRAGVRTMLGRKGGGGVAAKASDVAALVALVVIVALGLALQVASSRAASWLAEAIPVDGLTAWAVRVPAIAGGFVVDMLFVSTALVLLGGARARWRALLPVLLVSAAAVGALRQASSALVAGTLESPVLGPFAAIVTVLAFVELVTRVLLHAAAWLGSARVTPHVDVVQAVVVTDLPRGKRRSPVTTRRAAVRRR